MWVADGWKDYHLLDCGDGEKLERWGDYTLIRPDPHKEKFLKGLGM